MTFEQNWIETLGKAIAQYPGVMCMFASTLIGVGLTSETGVEELRSLVARFSEQKLAIAQAELGLQKGEAR